MKKTKNIQFVKEKNNGGHIYARNLKFHKIQMFQERFHAITGTWLFKHAEQNGIQINTLGWGVMILT